MPWLLCVSVATEMGHGRGQCPTSPSAQRVEQERLAEPPAEPALPLAQECFANDEIRGQQNG